MTVAIVGNDPSEGDEGRRIGPNLFNSRPRGTGDVCADLILSLQERVEISAFVVGHCGPCQQRDNTRRKHVSDEPLSAHGNPSYVRPNLEPRGRPQYSPGFYIAERSQPLH